jgi:Tol biopolymer transport system component
MIRTAMIAVLTAVSGSTAFAQSSDRITLADYLEWEGVGAPRLSPDGSQIIYARNWVDKVNDKRESSIYIMNADGSRSRRLLNGSSPIWSPDGTRIAYTATGEPTGTQIFVRYMDAEGAVTQVTRVTSSPGNIRWSPDNTSIAFTMQVPNTGGGFRGESQVTALRPRGATWTQVPRVVEKLDYRQDGQGFTADAVQHLFVVPADGGTPRQITSGEWSAGSAEWTPDGKSLVYSAGPRVPDAEYEWRESDVYSVDVATGTINRLTTRSGPDNNPAVSPNGRFIAYTGYDKTDDTWTDSRLYLMNADGSGSKLLLDLDRSPQGLTWAADNSGIYFTVQSEGAQNLHFVSVAGQARKVTEGKHMLAVSDVHPEGTATGPLTAPREPADIGGFDAR